MAQHPRPTPSASTIEAACWRSTRPSESLWHQAGPDREPDDPPIEGGIGEVVEIPGRDRIIWALTLPFDSGIALPPTRIQSPMKTL